MNTAHTWSYNNTALLAVSLQGAQEPCTSPAFCWEELKYSDFCLETIYFEYFSMLDVRNI
jgi:hypothetical protein